MHTSVLFIRAENWTHDKSIGGRVNHVLCIQQNTMQKLAMVGWVYMYQHGEILKTRGDKQDNGEYDTHNAIFLSTENNKILLRILM